MAPRAHVSSTKSERLAREKRRIEAELSGLNLARREIEKIRRLRENSHTKKWPSPGVH
jgi:hypothetical protein